METLMARIHAQQLDHLSMSMDATAAFPRPSHQHHNHHHIHHELAEGMDETTLLEATTPICNDSIAINPSTFSEANFAIGLNTNSSTSGRKQFCEISNVGSTTAPCKVKRRSWQEALAGSGAPLGVNIPEPGAQQISTSMLNTRREMQHPLELTSVEKILNLQHIQAGITHDNGTDPSHQLANPSTLTNSEIAKLSLEETLIAAHNIKIKATPTSTNPNYGGSFLSALNPGDEAFFKQKVVVPMEGYSKENPAITSAVRRQGLSIPFEDIAAHSGDALDILEYVKHSNKIQQQHGSAHELNINNILQSIKKQLKWSPNEEGSVVNYHKNNTGKDDDENVKASQDSASLHSNCSIARRVLSANGGNSAATNVVNCGFESKKRSLSDNLQGSACYNHMAHSKRAHLGKDSAPTRHYNSSTSMSTSTLIDGSTNIKTNAFKLGGKRNPLGPALNTNLKPRATQGTATDPQTLAARNRRERINARLKVLQELVPNGSKVDLVTMLEKAINYVKFLQLQLRVLSNDELWEGKQQDDDVEKVAMQDAVLISKSMEEEETNTACDRSPATATSCYISTILNTAISITSAQNK
ncbi:hypothetical protein GOP47_0026393 [Adiantum capillus-veneris]|nr:hypothetical protein GOP47_0026393 [Adiantum capillus-veneris]